MWTNELTASSQCLRANFCALSSLHKPFPTYQRQTKKNYIDNKNPKKKFCRKENENFEFVSVVPVKYIIGKPNYNMV